MLRKEQICTSEPQCLQVMLPGVGLGHWTWMGEGHVQVSSWVHGFPEWH